MDKLKYFYTSDDSEDEIYVHNIKKFEILKIEPSLYFGPKGKVIPTKAKFTGRLLVNGGGVFNVYFYCDDAISLNINLPFPT